MMVVKPYFYIIQNTELFEKTNILKSSGNSGLTDINCLFAGNIFPIKYYLPGVRFLHSGKKIKYSCLSGSIGTDQAIQFSLLNGNIKTVYRAETAK